MDLIGNIQSASSADMLAQKVKEGDRYAFSQLYDNYSPALYGVILKIVGREDIAEDVLQDSFIAIWNNIKSFDRSKGTLFTWMLNVARNKAIDKTRSSQFKTYAKTERVLDYVSIEDNDYRPDERADHNSLKNVVGLMKKDHQAVIQLLYYKGYTQVETAEELGIPLGTVKTRIRLALKYLKEIL